MRQIPKRNYVIYLLVCILTITLLIWWVNSYNNIKIYRDSTNERMNFLKEIKETELVNYLGENTDYAMYLSNSEENDFADLENSLRKKLVKKDYISNIIYVNTRDLSVDFLSIINGKYQTNLTSLPNLIVVNDGKIVSTYYISSNTEAKDIIKVLEEYYD